LGTSNWVSTENQTQITGTTNQRFNR